MTVHRHPIRHRTLGGPVERTLALIGAVGVLVTLGVALWQHL